MSRISLRLVSGSRGTRLFGSNFAVNQCLLFHFALLTGSTANDVVGMCDTTYGYDYGIAAGTVANRRLFVNTRELGGLPDGATVDRDGLYWVAVYQGGKIAAYRPDGKLERVVDMPVKLVSSVAFGGPNLDRLFVTTIAHGSLGEPVEPNAGSLYVIDSLGAIGRPEHRFAG